MARKLIETDSGLELGVPDNKPDLITAAKTGSRLTALQHLRDMIALTMVGTDSARDIAALSRQMTDVLAQIEAIEKASPEKKGSPLDELQNRRAARKPGAARSAGA